MTFTAELPLSYSPPSEDIDSIYLAKLERLKAGEWRSAAVPFTSNQLISRKKLEKLLYRAVESAWNQGGKTPEGAIEMLKKHQSGGSGLIKGMFSDKHGRDMTFAVQGAISTFSNYTRSGIAQTYESYVRREIGNMIRNSQSNEEALALAESYSFYDTPEDFRELIRKDVVALVRTMEVTGEEYVVPIGARDGFMDDLDATREKVADLAQSRYMTPVPKNRGFAGVISEEEYQQALEEIARSDPRYADDTGKAFISLKARDILESRGIHIHPSEFLTECKLR